MNKPDWPNLVCTRCGVEGSLWVEMRTEGSSYLSYEVVDCISCDKCGAEWDQDGEARATTWLADLDEKK